MAMTSIENQWVGRFINQCFTPEYTHACANLSQTGSKHTRYRSIAPLRTPLLDAAHLRPECEMTF